MHRTVMGESDLGLARGMIDVPIDTVIDHGARPVAPDAPLTDAAEYLRRPDVPALVVLDEDDAVVGVLTESDVVACVAETTTPVAVEHVMSSPVETVPITASVREAAERMAEAGVRRLPVVDAEETYCGLVSTETVAPYCSRKTVDVEWTDEPLTVEAADGSELIADD